MTEPESGNEHPGLGGIVTVTTRTYHRSGEVVDSPSQLIREQPVTLFLNGREIVTLLCAGLNLDELAAGFLYAEGFVRNPEDIKSLRVNGEAGTVEITTEAEPGIAEKVWSKRTVTSGCGKGTAFYHAIDALLARPSRSTLRATPGQIIALMEALNGLSETYRTTHGVHNTALATPEKLLLFRDDIGRHNAVDMIVGHVFLKGIDLSDKILVTTGRLTSEILLKAARVGIPMLVSRNAGTSLSVELARKLNITMIGYARGGRFTVYSGEERVGG